MIWGLETSNICQRGIFLCKIHSVVYCWNREKTSYLNMQSENAQVFSGKSYRKKIKMWGILNRMSNFQDESPNFVREQTLKFIKSRFGENIYESFIFPLQVIQQVFFFPCSNIRSGILISYIVLSFWRYFYAFFSRKENILFLVIERGWKYVLHQQVEEFQVEKQQHLI